MERIIVGSSTVTRRGQITIPKDLRKKYEIKTGDIIYFIELNGDLLIKRGPIKL
jgi:AbrB family looped-hinge helix DNA binding protein